MYLFCLFSYQAALQGQLQNQLSSSAYGFSQDTLMQEQEQDPAAAAGQAMTRVTLDAFNSDLNLSLDEDG